MSGNARPLRKNLPTYLQEHPELEEFPEIDDYGLADETMPEAGVIPDMQYFNSLLDETHSATDAGGVPSDLPPVTNSHLLSHDELRGRLSSAEVNENEGLPLEYASTDEMHQLLLDIITNPLLNEDSLCEDLDFDILPGNSDATGGNEDVPVAEELENHHPQQLRPSERQGPVDSGDLPHVTGPASATGSAIKYL